MTLEKLRVCGDCVGVASASGVHDALGDRPERPAKSTDRSSSWSSMKRGSSEKSSDGKKAIVSRGKPGGVGYGARLRA